MARSRTSPSSFTSCHREGYRPPTSLPPPPRPPPPSPPAHPPPHPSLLMPRRVNPYFSPNREPFSTPSHTTLIMTQVFQPSNLPPSKLEKRRGGRGGGGRRQRVVGVISETVELKRVALRSVVIFCTVAPGALLPTASRHAHVTSTSPPPPSPLFLPQLLTPDAHSAAKITGKVEKTRQGASCSRSAFSLLGRVQPGPL